MVLKISKTTDFSSESLYKCFEKLDETEKQYIVKKRNADAQKCSLAARILLIDGLKEHYGIENPLIKRNENGKPFLPDNKVYFSISHTRDTVAVAFSDKPVGMDIEYVREYNGGVCRKMFSVPETEFVNGDNTKFTKLWTLKEAAVKSTGQKISKIKDYNFDLSGENVVSNLKNAHFTVENQDDLIISVCQLN